MTGEGADRNPDGRLMKAGSLVSVTYPTGGKTVFEMESNKLEDGSIWGGLRVKSISNYDSDGNTLLSYKRYEYQDVRQSVSKDDFSKLYSFLSDYSFYMKYDDVLFDGHGAACRNTSVSIPAIPLSADYGSPIYYYKVTEYLEDNNGILGKKHIPISFFTKFFIVCVPRISIVGPIVKFLLLIYSSNLLRTLPTAG